MEIPRWDSSPPLPVFGDLLSFLSKPDGWAYLSVIFPMGLFNVVGSLQNLESAEAAGDSYRTRPSLLANGIGTVAAAFLGSPFPTTIYIGHPGWKAMGARAGYSVLNGVVVTLLCLVGGVGLVNMVVPLEAAAGILLWIGIIILAQSFQDVPKRHALAVAFGLIPALAAWGLNTMLLPGLGGRPLADLPPSVQLKGLVALNQGFLLTSMILAAMLVFIIDRQFRRAACWALAAAVLSQTGLIHACRIEGSNILSTFGWAEATDFAFAYGLTALFLLVLHIWLKRQEGVERITARLSPPSDIQAGETTRTRNEKRGTE